MRLNLAHVLRSRREPDHAAAYWHAATLTEAYAEAWAARDRLAVAAGQPSIPLLPAASAS